MANRKLGQASISHFFAPRGGDAPKKKKTEEKTPKTEQGAKTTTSTNGLEAFAAKRTANSPAKGTEKTPSTAVAQDSGNGISSPPKEAPARKRVRRILVENEGKDEEPSHASETDSAEADVPVKPRRKAAGAAQGKIAALSEFTRDHENDSPSPKKAARSSATDPAAASPSENGMPSPVAVRRPELRLAPALTGRSPAEVRALLMQEARGSKLTPLETQFIKVKSENPDAVLLVEVGYKFFGDDAEIAHRVLNIYCAKGHNNFRSASIPVQRLFVHIRRLVDVGYKVGVVRQTETAALKKVSTTKSKVFTRELSALYTKSTLFGEEIGDDAGVGDLASTTNYLLCLFEQAAGDDRVEVGLVALQCSTGDIVYDTFEDDLSRQALETRLAHLDPSEVLLPPTLSERTEKVLRLHALSGGSTMREERIQEAAFDMNTSVRRITDFFDSEGKDAKGGARLGSVLALPPAVQTCMAALIDHLRAFKLERVLRLTGNLQAFAESGTSLQMNACTLHNLEILHNATDGRFEGSLLWLMDRTSTPFGRRLFRRWVTHPLVSLKSLLARQRAVKELVESDELCLNEAKEALVNLPDLERNICSVYNRRSSPAELSAALSAMEHLYVVFKGQASAAREALASDLLRDLFEQVADLFAVAANLSVKLDASAAKKNDKVNLLVNCVDIFPSQNELKEKLKEVDAALFRHRAEVRKIVSNPVLEYTTVSGDDYLVEVKNKDVSRVPKDWIKMSGTKSVARFRSPFIVEQLELRSQLRERLEIDAGEAWLKFMGAVSKHYEELRRGVQMVAQFDCLLSLAKLATQEHYILPAVDEGETAYIRIRRGRHPVVSAAMSDQYVPNDTSLVADGQRCHLITGPNMGGKSSYIRQVALLVVMAQVGSYIPAEEAKLGVVDAIFTRMGASDNIFRGSSTFMVELQEAATALSCATSRSLVIMDELGRGTSTHDGVAIAYATMNHLVSQVKCLTLFVTHYPSLAELAVRLPKDMSCYHMAFVEVEDKETAEDGPDEEITTTATSAAGQQSSHAEAVAAAVPSAISFLYQLTPGLAQRSYGLNVARLAGIPTDILQQASVQSHRLEQLVARRRPVDGVMQARVVALAKAQSAVEIGEVLRQMK